MIMQAREGLEGQAREGNMLHNFHLKSILLTVIFVLIGSALLTTRAAADDGAPPTDAPVVSTPDADTGVGADKGAVAPEETPVAVEPTAVPTDAPEGEIVVPVEEDISQPSETSRQQETLHAFPEGRSDDLALSTPDTEVV